MYIDKYTNDFLSTLKRYIDSKYFENIYSEHTYVKFYLASFHIFPDDNTGEIELPWP